MTEPNASSAIEVHAAPEHVYMLVADPGALAELAEEYRGYRWLDGAARAEVGARFRGSNRHGWSRWSTIATITDADVGSRFAFEVAVVGVRVARWQYDLTATDAGCLVTEGFWEQRPGWLKRVGTLYAGISDRDTHNQRNIEVTLGRLKDKAERGR